MKKIIVLIVMLSMLLLMSATVSARGDDRDRQHRHRHDNNKKYHRVHYKDRDYERHLPFRWHDRFYSMRDHHRLERIQHDEWRHRFPGLQAYRSHGHHGFWHHGRYVKDAIFFFNRDHELVSIGYMHNGLFIHFRSDDDYSEDDDSFFLAWWNN